MNREERYARLEHIRIYGTLASAEDVARKVIDAMPDEMPTFGIFPTGCGDEPHGDGGICIETFTASGGAVVDIMPDGALDDGFCCGVDWYREEHLGSPASAAAFLSQAAAS